MEIPFLFGHCLEQYAHECYRSDCVHLYELLLIFGDQKSFFWQIPIQAVVPFLRLVHVLFYPKDQNLRHSGD